MWKIYSRIVKLNFISVKYNRTTVYDEVKCSSRKPVKLAILFISQRITAAVPDSARLPTDDLKYELPSQWTSGMAQVTQCMSCTALVTWLSKKPKLDDLSLIPGCHYLVPGEQLRRDTTRESRDGPARDGPAGDGPARTSTWRTSR